MKNIKLEQGYLVSDWQGEITKVSYKLVPTLHYGSVEERFLLVDENNVFLEMLPEYKKQFICGSLKEAETLSVKLKERRKNYYLGQIKDYQKRIEELS